MIFKTALIKLMFWYMLLAVSLSLIFSVVLYHFATEELSEGLRQEIYLIDSHTDHDTDDRISIPAVVDGSKRLRLQLLYFNIVVFVGSTAFSYMLARRTLKPIEEAHNAQIRFTAEASHELRTPLTAMRADTESVLLLKNKSAQMLEQTLRDNLADVKRLEALTNHLLSVARYKSKVVSFSEFGMKAAAVSAVEQAERFDKDRKVKFHITGPEIMVFGDQLSMQLVVATILDNAAKYSRSGSTVRISLAKQAGFCLVTIKDSGVGISKQDLPHIFEYYYSSKDTATEAVFTRGYGLGLPLARDIMKLHHGSIAVQSAIGTRSGTTVSVRIPLAEEN